MKNFFSMFNRNRPDDFSRFEERIGYTFQDKRLIRQALTHRSFRYEQSDINLDNERLEFLGDAILGFLVAARLYELYNGKHEGELTSMRSQMTSGKSLARVADHLGIGSAIRIGRGDEKSGGRTRASTLADAFEAVLGAAYLDGGVTAAQKIVNILFEDDQLDSMACRWDGNPKGRLQEIAQMRWKTPPVYAVVDEHGPSHDKRYSVHVIVNQIVMGNGVGTSKRAAETLAAREALERIEREEVDEQKP